MAKSTEGRLGPFVLTYWDRAGKEQKLTFPVAPQSLSVKYAHEFQEVSILGLGQADFRGGDQLAELTFSSFFPRDYDPTLLEPDYIGKPYLLKPPADYEKIIHEIRQVGKPARLFIGASTFEASVMIRSFDVDYRPGEPEDLYYTITFKKHRLLSVQKTGGASASNARPPSAPAPKTYKVVSGDTLWGIAKRHLGDGSKWPEIYKLNTGVIGKDPNLIRPGQVLQLPNSGKGVDAPSIARASKEY